MFKVNTKPELTWRVYSVKSITWRMCKDLCVLRTHRIYITNMDCGLHGGCVWPTCWKHNMWLKLKGLWSWINIFRPNSCICSQPSHKRRQQAEGSWKIRCIMLRQQRCLSCTFSGSNYRSVQKIWRDKPLKAMTRSNMVCNHDKEL